MVFFDALISVNAENAQKTAPPVSVDESLSVTVTDSQPVAGNFVDCTESNDEEEEEEEEVKEEGKGDAKLKEEEVNDAMKESERSKGTEKMEVEVEGSSNPPKWQDFFTTETLPDSQNSINSLNSLNSLKSQSQSCCSAPSTSPSRMTDSQTPELFSEEEETPNNDENFSLTLSASLSNHSSQNLDSYLPDTLILQPEQAGREQGDSRTNNVSQEKESKDQNVQSELEEFSQESRVSSDFEIPCTPESKKPREDELSQLYRKLAAGEDVVIRKCLQ